MQERRRAPRITGKDQVVVSVFSAPGTPGLEQRTFFCSSRDLSADGLQLAVPALIPPGSRIFMSVALLDPALAFRHEGEIAWCRPADKTGAFLAGIRIIRTLDNRGTSWKRAIGARFAKAVQNTWTPHRPHVEGRQT